jgi:hypothetical protein
VRLDQDTIWALLDDAGLRLDAAEEAERIDPLVSVLASGEGRSAVERIARQVAVAVWSPELGVEARAALETYRAELERRIAAIDSTLTDLGKAGAASQLLRALVTRAAAEALVESTRIVARLRAVDDRLAKATADERRLVAIGLADEVIDVVGIPEDEEDEAFDGFLQAVPSAWERLPSPADPGWHWLIRALATEERRTTVRTSLGSLADAAAEDFPAVSAELTALLAEAVPRDPAEDEVWAGFVRCLAREAFGHDEDDDDPFFRGVAAQGLPGARDG